MFIQRAIVTLTLGPLALFLVYQGGWWFFVPVTAVFLVATAEYLHIIEKIGWQPARWLLFVAVFAQMTSAQWPTLGMTTTVDLRAVFLFVSLLLALAYALWLYEMDKSKTAVADWFSMLSGILIIGWVGGHLLRLRALDSSGQWTILALIAIWTADTGAYLVGRFLTGRLLGRHQLTPRLSPKKTIEGYIGGILISILFTILAAIVLNLPTTVALLIALFSASLGLLGDLGMSLLKRQAGVKDSGTLFPGHGGALDRIDSLIWSVAIAYYLILWVA